MGRRTVAHLAVAIGLLSASACSGSTSITNDKGWLSERRIVSRGALGYAVAMPDASVLVSVELDVDFYLVVRKPNSPRELGRILLGPHEWDVNDLVATQDRAWVASSDGTLREIALPSGPILRTLATGQRNTAVAVSPDGRYLASASSDGVLCLRRLRDAALLQCLIGSSEAMTALAFAPQSLHLASASTSGEVRVWTVPALAPVASVDVGQSANHIAFAPRSWRLAIAASTAAPHGSVAQRARIPSQLLLWQPVAGSRPAVHGQHVGAMAAVAWSSDERLMVSGGWDGAARLWDVSNRRQLGQIRNLGPVRDVAWSRESTNVALATWAERSDGPATVLLTVDHPPYSGP